MTQEPSTVSRFLPCGRDPVDVWDHAAANELDIHERTCRYCQGVVAEYWELAQPLYQLASEVVEPPASLLERVMATVRAALRMPHYLPLPSPYGPVRIDMVTATMLLRYAVDQTPGCRARSCRIESAIDPTIGVDQDQPPIPSAVNIDISIVAELGANLDVLAGNVRHVLRTVVLELLGLRVEQVDVGIVDLFTTGETTPPTS